MKKRILLATMLVATIMLSACGKKETEVETKVPETKVETNTEAKESSGEVSTEGETEVEVTTENDEMPVGDLENVVVEEPATDKLIVGNDNVIEWGGFKILSNEKGFNNGVITFFDKKFEISLPQDVGAATSYEANSVLNLFNESNTNIFSFVEWVPEDGEIEKLNEYGKEEYLKYWFKKDIKFKEYYFSKETKNNMEFIYMETLTEPTAQAVTLLIKDEINNMMYGFSFATKAPISMDIARKVIDSIKLLQE